MDPAFFGHVMGAFRVSTSELALSRSPLAQGALVGPALVFDELAPTADERGEALRFALMWAIERLAPAPAHCPLGTERPLDDPTLRDPAWAAYNVLRHRYLEPFHPKDYIEAELYAETLIALFGMRSAAAYFDAREQGLHEAAEWLWRQHEQGIGNERIRALVLESLEMALDEQPAARTLLGIASVFNGVFAVRTLNALAIEENVRYPERALETLVARRFLLSGDGSSSLWMSPTLRTHVAAQQYPERQVRRHRLAARLAREEGHPLAAAFHLVEAGLWLPASQALLTMGASQRGEYESELLELVSRMEFDDLSAEVRVDLRLFAAALCHKQGRNDEAQAACRLALEDAREDAQRAAVYRQLAAIVEEGDPEAAATYLAAALDKMPADHGDRVQATIDLAWLAIELRNWGRAETALATALDAAVRAQPTWDQAPAAALAQLAEIHDAYSSARRGREDYASAVDHAERSLALYVKSGDQMRTGKAFNTLGILRRLRGQYVEAIEAYRNALVIFSEQGNRALEATALLNLGTAFHFDDRVAEAEGCYRRCLALADEVGLPLTEVRAHANLCEALMQMGREVEARGHWRHAYRLSAQSGFDGEIRFLADLCERYAGLRSELDEIAGEREAASSRAPEQASRAESWPPAPVITATHDADEALALGIAQETGQVRASTLMEKALISKATATRKLTRLADAGLIARHGQGRSTYYTRASSVPVAIVAGDLVALQARLDAILPRMGKRFGVSALRAVAVVQAADANGSVVGGHSVAAQFDKLPSMADFIALERDLCRSTGTDIRLVLPSM